jgi:hypothetical protein
MAFGIHERQGIWGFGSGLEVQNKQGSEPAIISPDLRLGSSIREYFHP